MLALHNECLTRRYLLDRLNLLEGLLGFGLGVVHALEGLRTLGLLCLGVMLQGLKFFDEVSELFLDLINPSLLFLMLSALLGRLVQFDQLLQLVAQGNQMFGPSVLRPEQLLCRAPFFGTIELRGIRYATRQICERSWRAPNSGK